MRTSTNGALSVFLVDDDNTFLASLKHYLQQKLNHNFNISTFTTGEECLKNLEQKPDVVVVDYLLNGERSDAMNGLQVLEKIKSFKPGTAVIMISGQNNTRVAADSIKQGAFDYVQKNENVLSDTKNMIKQVFALQKTAEQKRFYKMFLWVLFSVLLILTVVATIISTVFLGQLPINP